MSQANNKFCHECGHKMQFFGTPPKFCAECGTNLTSLAFSRKKRNHTSSANQNSEELSDDETDYDYVPDCEGFSVNIEKPRNAFIETGGSLIGEGEKKIFKPSSKKPL